MHFTSFPHTNKTQNALKFQTILQKNNDDQIQIQNREQPLQQIVKNYFENGFL